MECNIKKGGRTLREAGMRILRPPRKPNWTPFFRVPQDKVKYKEWIPFIENWMGQKARITFSAAEASS
jgi:hypothetical protein